MRNWVLAAIITATAIVVLLSVEGASNDASPAAMTPVKVGFIAPLTGNFQSYGKMIQEGVELAKEEFAAEGISIEVIGEDGCLPHEAVAAARKLVEIDRISALAANYCVIALPPIAPIFGSKGIPVFQTSVTPRSVLEVNDSVLTTNASIESEASRLAHYAKEELSADRAAILFLQTQWGETFATAFRQDFEKLGGAITTAESHPIGTYDFRTALTRLKSGQPDVIFLAHIGPMLGTAAKQARELGIGQQLLSTDESEDYAVIEAGGESVANLHYFSPGMDNVSSESRSFIERYKIRFGRNPGVLAANAYDSTRIAVRAVIKCKSDKHCIRDVIFRTKNFKGASGEFSLLADKSAQREFVLKKIANGRFERVP
jgi:branched-chain amino acid transport system substrate-binding protein